METLDIDDLSFFPCSCGYQVGVEIVAILTHVYRFVAFAGIAFALRKMGSAPRAAHLMLKSLPNSILFLKTT